MSNRCQTRYSGQSEQFSQLSRQYLARNRRSPQSKLGQLPTTVAFLLNTYADRVQILAVDFPLLQEYGAVSHLCNLISRMRRWLMKYPATCSSTKLAR